jgi:hypothetical protein
LPNPLESVYESVALPAELRRLREDFCGVTSLSTRCPEIAMAVFVALACSICLIAARKSPVPTVL